MERELEEDVYNVMNRWDSVGLLSGLPIREKIELSFIYDNATKLLLSNYFISKVPKKVVEYVEVSYIPICRRLYRRLGPNFDLENMLGELLESVSNNINELSNQDDNAVKDPIVSFCVDFCDNYEDDTTTQHLLSDDEYAKKIDNMLNILREVMLNNFIVSRVDLDNDFKIKFIDTLKPKSVTRFSNQNKAKQLMEIMINDINKNFD